MNILLLFFRTEISIIHIGKWFSITIHISHSQESGMSGKLIVMFGGL